MAKYIDFDIAIRKLDTWYNDLVDGRGNDEDFVKGYSEAINDLADVPATDVQDVKHAKWICRPDCGCTVCSNCKGSVEEYVAYYNYCMWCGARMDLEDNK